MKIKDIAILSGVSISTVSRVMNNYDNVPEETRKKIMEVVNKYNYIPNSTARILSGKDNKFIGLFVVELSEIRSKDVILKSAWMTDVIAAVVSQASLKNYKTLVTLVNTKDDLGKVSKMFMDKTISGGIFVGIEERDDLRQELYKLDTLGYKFTVFEHDILDELLTNNAIFVNTDNLNGAYEATKFLIKNGHKRIVHLMGNINKSPTNNRLQGYKKALEEYDISNDNNLIVLGNYSKKTSYSNIQKLLSEGIKFSAIFAGSDDMAFGAIKALKDNGLNIPQDISVIGYDDTIVSKLADFSSVKPDQHTMADLLVNPLISSIENKNTIQKKYIVKSNLKIRNSVKKI